jgi:hypothetical protein
MAGFCRPWLRSGVTFASGRVPSTDGEAIASDTRPLQEPLTPNCGTVRYGRRPVCAQVSRGIKFLERSSMIRLQFIRHFLCDHEHRDMGICSHNRWHY